MNVIPERWYTLREFSEIVRISYWTIRERAMEGDIPGAIKLGSIWRIPDTAIQELMKASTKG